MACRKQSQKGSAILMVLVVVAIIMVLYFVQIDTFFGPGLPTQPKGIEQHPWILEELLVPENQPIKLPRSPKPTLDDPLTVTLPVHLEDADRGTSRITFLTNGRIQCQWECVYTSTDIEYRIEAAMNGNIVAKRTYSDENGKDKSRLFFIAKGYYTKTPTDLNADQTGELSEKGTSWLTGWLGPDLTPQGHITITTNREWAGVYTLAAP